MRFSLLVVLATVSACPTARAQDADATPDAEQDVNPDDTDTRARGLFLAGEAAFNRAQFEEALGYFEGAFRLSERPQLLFNIGLAAQRAGRRDRAIEAFRQYLESIPDAANRPDVEARIASLEATAEQGPGPEPPSGGAGDGGGPGIVPWVVIGVWAAVAIIGGVLLGAGLSDVGAVEDAPLDASWADYESRYDRAPALTTLGFVLLGTGIAGAAVGVVLLTMGGSDESAAVSLGPGTLELRGTF